MPRDAGKVLRDVSDMRAKMLEGHPNNTSLFDVKHDRGGMVDIEFAVQAMVLIHSHNHPELINNFGNILLLEMMGSLGLIERKLANRCAGIYRTYRNVQRNYRLAHGLGSTRVDPKAYEQEAKSVRALWQTVFGSSGPERSLTV